MNMPMCLSLLVPEWWVCHFVSGYHRPLILLNSANAKGGILKDPPQQGDQNHDANQDQYPDIQAVIVPV